MVDVEGTKNYSFDDLNRMSQAVNIGQNNFTLNYTYNLFNELLSTQNTLLPSGQNRMSYTYYENGEVKTRTDVDGSSMTYYYNAIKELIEKDYPGGIATSKMSYDPVTAQLVKTVNRNSKNEVLSRVDYGYDSAGYLTSSADLVGCAYFSYDNLNRLFNANYPGGRGTTHYTYDKVGNRNTLMVNGSTTVNNYDQATDEITSAGTYSFTYDNAGNMLSKAAGQSGKHFSLDGLNRLVEARNVSDGIIADFQYNGDGWRDKKISAANGTTNYLMDRGAVVLETDGSGTITKRFNPGISAVDSQGNKVFYLSDGRGNVAGLMDAKGNLVQNYTYDAFGKAIGVRGDKNGYRFVGKFRVFSDDEVGLIYMKHRWYDPDLGRFISRDPIGFGGGANSYVYVRNSPLNLFDPFGLCEIVTGGHDPLNDSYLDHTPYPAGFCDFGASTTIETAFFLAGIGISAYGGGFALYEWLALNGSALAGLGGGLLGAGGVAISTSDLLGNPVSSGVAIGNDAVSLGVDLEMGNLGMSTWDALNLGIDVVGAALGGADYPGTSGDIGPYGSGYSNTTIGN
jgi:RHS repeat-associated protein